MKARIIGFFLVFLTVTVVSGCGAPEKPHHQLTSEQQWLVSSIGRDIEEMVFFASKHNSSNADFSAPDLVAQQVADNTYDLSLKDKSGSFHTRIEFNQYLWNPASYSGFAKQLASTLGLRFTQSTADTSSTILAKLADFDAKTLAEANRELSDRLSSNPLDEDTNYEAALLCAVYALRDHAACYTDLRQWLNRITAHLSIAEAAQKHPDKNLAGILSNSILLCLSGRESDGLKIVSELEPKAKDNGVLASWLRAIKIRATNDYRIADLKQAHLIEKNEYSRWLSYTQGSDALTDYIRTEKMKNPPIDWLRSGMRAMRSVEAGHVYCDQGINAEVNDAAADIYFFKGVKVKTADQVVAELRQYGGGCLERQDGKWRLTPITWSQLSDFHDRLLLDAINQEYFFLVSMWGVPERAKQMLEQSDKAFSSLPLYSTCKLNCLLEKTRRIEPDIFRPIMEIATQEPQRLNFRLWYIAHRFGSSVVPEYDTWFGSGRIYGTTFDYDYRAGEFKKPTNNIDLDELRTLTPYNQELLRDIAEKKYHGKATGEQLSEIYGPILQYNLSAMTAVSDAYWTNENYEKYAQTLANTCKFHPDSYFVLGAFYENRNPRKALEAYENGLKFARNEVLIANNCYWLVNYYYDHSQKDKAVTLAKHVAEIYSRKGLTTLADLYERMGRLAEAEDVYHKIKERYDIEGPIAAFYFRHANENPKYKDSADSFVKTIFPDGLKHFAAASSSDAPTSGVIVLSNSFRTEEMGIKRGDIIVATNGWQVANEKQFEFASKLTMNPQIEVVVWDKTKLAYRTAKNIVSFHRLDCKYRNYRAKPHASPTKP